MGESWSKFCDNNYEAVAVIVVLALIFLCVSVIILFLAVLCMRYKYTKQIRMLRQQRGLRDRGNLYVNGHVLQSVEDHEEETELTGNNSSSNHQDSDQQTQQAAQQVNESANYDEIEIQDKPCHEAERYCNINPLNERHHVTAAASTASSHGNNGNDDDNDSIFGQFTSTSATERVEYCTLTDEIITSALNKKPPASRKPRKGSTAVSPNYESIEKRVLEVHPGTNPADDMHLAAGKIKRTGDEDLPGMGVVTKSRCRRTNSRVNYDDVVMPATSLPRSGSEVARERRRIDFTSSQPVRPQGNSGNAVNPNSIYSSLIHIELMKIHQRAAAQKDKNNTAGKEGAALYSTLTGTPERFKRMPKECMP